MNKSLIVEIISVLLIILFLYAGISKLMDYNIFKEQLGESKILSPFSPIIALMLPVFELAVALMLISSRLRLKGLYASLSLMAVFTVYIIAILLFSPTLPCSCGGVLEELSWQQHIIFNCAFIGLSTWGILFQNQIKKQSHAEYLQLANKESIAL